MSEVSTVDVVFKTHLDLGFTGLASEVTRQYLEHFIPKAMDLAEEMRARDGDERFVWTTGSWLIHTALERGDRAMRRRLEAAIEAGDLVWHALPFTMHSELLTPELFEFGLIFSKRLDERFGRTTIAAKFTDVPGHTRGIVPLLAGAGVELLHIGVNPASTPPAVPRVFRWSTGGSVITVVYQRGGYGDLTVVDGCGHALAFAHSGDNLGPPSADDIVATFAALRERVPGAEVRVSTLDAFTEAMRPLAQDLPVVTQEIGDTWIHGIGSDPQKLARYAGLVETWNRLAFSKRSNLSSDSPRVERRSLWDPRVWEDRDLAAAGEALLLVAEHTWGMDEKTFLPDVARWDRAGLAEFRRERATQRFEASWTEQRSYLDRAHVLLSRRTRPASPIVRFRSRVPGRPDLEGWVPVDGPTTIEAHALHATVDPATGSAVRLADEGDGRELASAENPIGRFGYQTFDEADYERWHATYNCASAEDEWWAVLDFTKPGIDAAGAESRWWDPEPRGMWRSPDRRQVVVELAGHPEAVARFGCPPTIFVNHTFSRNLRRAGGISSTVQWFDKPASRLPEALWWSVVPAVDGPDGWRLKKLGLELSPLDVVEGGGRRLHACAGVSHRDPKGRPFAFGSLDAPLIAPGAPSLLRFDDEPLDLSGGVHVNLANNVWGTNFPMWIEGDAGFRFFTSVSPLDQRHVPYALPRITPTRVGPVREQP